MYLSNIPVDMVFDDDPLEKLEEYAMIVLPNLVMLDELQITRLRKYAEQGGMLFITGLPGIKAQDGTTRPLEKVLSLLGITSVPKKVTAEPSNFTVKYDGEESGTILGQQSEYIFEDAQNKGFSLAEKALPVFGKR